MNCQISSDGCFFVAAVLVIAAVAAVVVAAAVVAVVQPMKFEDPPSIFVIFALEHRRTLVVGAVDAVDALTLLHREVWRVGR